MDTPASIADMILIVTDITTDANLVKDILKPEFNHVATSTDPEKLAVDFASHRPSVLVLAFNTLEKSEHYYLELHRLCEAVHQCPHRTVILCSKGELKRVYELCKHDHFDDYVLFWPMSQDSSRLLMSIHNALRELATLKTEGPSAAEFATQARQLAKLEKVLGQQMDQGSRQIEAANRAMEQAEHNIGAALDGFSQRLISDSPPGAEGVNSADGIKNAVDRFKREEIQQHFRTAAKSTQPLKRWAQEFKQECEPFLESARTLNAMAERIRPTVLVVDDDDLQRKLIGTLLEAENYRLVFASDGFDALNVVLRKTRPDIILMDVMMPGMNGMEATRRVKSIPHFSKTPVIMITGKSEGQVVVNSLKAGAVDFVVKPYVRATLLNKIDRALNAPASPPSK